MTVFWITAAILSACAVVPLLWPLLRHTDAATGDDRAERDLAVYRDQIAELERERAEGMIDAAAAQAAKAEIGRRMLAVAEAGGPPAMVTATTGMSSAMGMSATVTSLPGDTTARSPQPLMGGRLVLAITILLLVPLGALSVYLPLGHPERPGQPWSPKPESTAAVPPEILEALGKLERHLETTPSDRKGWMLLGQVYARMARHEDSINAYRKARTLAPEDPEAAGALGEALTVANRGTIPEEAQQAFTAVLAKDPRNPRARYYAAIAREQAGDAAGALDALVALIADSTADAPWLPVVRERATTLAKRLNRDPATVIPAPAPALPAAPPAASGAAPPLAPEQLAEAKSLSPEERQKRVRAMVEALAGRLRESPGDADGWLKLANSYDVLGEKDKADAAVRQAVAAAPKRIDVLLAYSDRLLAEVPEDAPPGPLPPAFVQVMRDIQAIDPDNGDALWFLGLEAANTGQPKEAAALWARLLAKIPADSPDAVSLKARIAELGGIAP